MTQTPPDPASHPKLRRLGHAVADRPRITALVLAIAGVAVRQAWITTRPLTAGDWHWPSRGRMLFWFPWPTIWDSTLGFGGENRFLEAFRFPVFALSGAVAAVGSNWTVAEKLIYFVPYAVLLPLAGWLLAREILGSTRWALLAPVILLGNTYFILESNGHVPLPLGEMLGCLALVAFLRAMRTYSRRYALGAGLLVSAAAVGDIRAAYITVWLMAAYLVVLVAAEPVWRRIVRRVLLSAAAGASFVATQAFWIVPLLTYHGHPGFPTPQSPNFNIITLAHGIAGVAAGWSGGVPAPLVQAPLNPVFMALPLLAVLPLVARRVRPEMMWLALAAVVFAFLAKTNTPPFGGLYDLLYRYLPGFKLFREGSKFLFPVGVAYAILVPAALQALFERSRAAERRPDRLIRAGAVVGLAAVLLVTVSTIVVLESGDLGSSTQPVNEPLAFSQMDKLLNSDPQPGSVLWIGEPVYSSPGGKNHRYLITSPTHPAVNLTGNVNSTLANQRDDFEYYCPTITQAFCYLTPGLFPYLVSMSGSSYIVSPGSADIGSLPEGVTRSWLRQQLTAMFGPPRQLGRGGTTLLVWHSGHTPAIAGYPAAALIDSGTWSTGAAMPALQAMGIPVVYRQTFNQSNFPPAPANLPESVAVVPYLGGGYRSSAARSVGVLAQTSSAALDATVNGSTLVLPLLTRSPRLPGWGLYGPISIPAGFTSVVAASPAGLLGPGVAWSMLARTAFGSHPQPIGPTRVGAHGEHLSAAAHAAPTWIELTRLYDPGWRVGAAKPVAPGEGLFNLYLNPRVKNGGISFTFSTMPWERRGQVIAALALLVTVALIVRGRRQVDDRRPAPSPAIEGRVGRQVALVGLALLAATAAVVVLQWVGWPSLFPKLTVGADPYTLDQVTGTMALGLLAASIVIRLGERMFRRVPVAEPLSRPRHTRTALAAVACLLATSCSALGGGGAQALSAAQLAGAPSGNSAGGALDDARLLQAAKRPHACIADYTRALRSFPNLAAAYTGRAGCYLSGAISAPGAVHDFTRALALAPDNAGGYLNLAVGDRAVGNFATSIQNYARAIAVPNATPGNALTAVDSVLKIGTVSQARAILTMAQQRFPTSSAVEVAAADVALAADDGTALADLARAQALADGSNADESLALAHLCHAQVVTHDYSAALTTCATSAQLNTDGSGAYDDLAAADAALGNLDGAITAVTSAIGATLGSAGPYDQLAGVDGFGLASLYEARGRLEVERDEPGLAIADYQHARAVLPTASPDFRARLKADIKTAQTD